MFDFRRRWSATLNNRGHTIRTQEQTALILAGVVVQQWVPTVKEVVPPPPPGGGGGGCTIL